MNTEIPHVDDLLIKLSDWIADTGIADRYAITRKDAESIIGYVGMLEAALTAELNELPKIEIERLKKRISSR